MRTRTNSIKASPLAILALLVLSSLGVLSIAGPQIQSVHATGANLGIVIPLYESPDSDWGLVLSEATAYPSVQFTIVINIDNGPGSSYSSTYNTAINDLQANHNTRVLGYIYTDYGSRPLADAEADVTTWKSFYPQINGIWIDNQSPLASFVTYYTDLESFITSTAFPSSFTIGNPGEAVASGQTGIFNVVNSYERHGTPSTMTLASRTGGSPAGWSFIAQGITNAADTNTTYLEEISAYTSTVFITSQVVYTSLPSYFVTLVENIAIVDGTVPGAPSLVQLANGVCTFPCYHVTINLGSNITAGDSLIVAASFESDCDVISPFGVTDTYSNTFSVVSHESCIGPEDFGAYIYLATVASTETSDAVTFSLPSGASEDTNVITMAVYDVKGLYDNVVSTGNYNGTAICTGVGGTCPHFLRNDLNYYPNDFMVGIAQNDWRYEASFWTAGPGFTLNESPAGCGGSASSSGCSQYMLPSSESDSDFPMTFTLGDSVSLPSLPFVEAAVVLGPVTAKNFDVGITNADCGNCVIAGNGKYYDFHVNLTSNAITDFGYQNNFTYAYIQFNDSLHIVNVQYNFTTGQTTVNENDANIVSVGNTVASESWNPVTEIASATLDFYITFNANALTSSNRGIILLGCISASGDAPNYCRGPTYEDVEPFNIIANGGGLTNTTQIGGCTKLPTDVFSTQCKYSTGVTTGNIQTNSSWVYLQSYSTQFSINAGPVSEGTGNWTQTIGFYFYDNTTWVLGPNVRLYFNSAKLDSQNEWLILNTDYYFGDHSISNQTISSWLPVIGGMETPQIYVDLWYSSINASTTWGARVNAYYVGMSASCFISCFFGENWNPVYNNQSTTEAFGTLYNHLGAIQSSTLIECTQVFQTWNLVAMTEGENIGAGTFNIEQFNLAASGAQMQGVPTPVYTQPLVPIIASTSNFLSPLYAIFAALGGLFAKSLQALGAVVLAGLQAKFPWLINGLDAFASLIIEFWALLSFLVVFLLDILAFMLRIIDIVLIPIDVIIAAYNYIATTYINIFGGVNILTVVEIFVLAIFATTVLDWAENGETGKFVALARGAWGIVNAIMYWVWAIAKLLIDFIEGLIP